MGIPAEGGGDKKISHNSLHHHATPPYTVDTVLRLAKTMAKQHKSSRISVAVAALSALFLFLLVFNYYHSMNIGRITAPNSKQNLHDQLDLRHFSVMNETLSGLNQELRRIMALHKTKLETEPSLQDKATSPTANQPHIVPRITNVASSSSHGPFSAVITPKTSPRPQGNITKLALSQLYHARHILTLDIPVCCTSTAVTPAATVAPRTRSSSVKKALLYTMDSISSYEEDSKRGHNPFNRQYQYTRVTHPFNTHPPTHPSDTHFHKFLWRRQ